MIYGYDRIGLRRGRDAGRRNITRGLSRGAAYKLISAADRAGSDFYGKSAIRAEIRFTTRRPARSKILSPIRARHRRVNLESQADRERFGSRAAMISKTRARDETRFRRAFPFRARAKRSFCEVNTRANSFSRNAWRSTWLMGPRASTRSLTDDIPWPDIARNILYICIDSRKHTLARYFASFRSRENRIPTDSPVPTKSSYFAICRNSQRCSLTIVSDVLRFSRSPILT